MRWIVLALISFFWFLVVGPIFVSAQSTAMVVGWFSITFICYGYLIERFIHHKKRGKDD